MKPTEQKTKQMLDDKCSVICKILASLERGLLETEIIMVMVLAIEMDMDMVMTITIMAIITAIIILDVLENSFSK